MSFRILSKPVVRFLLVFVVCYGLLIFPWPGWEPVYGAGFRAAAQTLLGGRSGDRFLRFQASERPTRPALTTTILLGNIRQAGPDGRGPMLPIQIDTRSLGWMPTAVFTALVLAAPTGWRRRLLSLGAGMILVHGYILGCLLALIWHRSGEVGLVRFNSFTAAWAAGLEATLVTHIWSSFAIPALIWLLVTFRADDLAVPNAQGE